MLTIDWLALVQAITAAVSLGVLSSCCSSPYSPAPFVAGFPEVGLGGAVATPLGLSTQGLSSCLGVLH